MPNVVSLEENDGNNSLLGMKYSDISDAEEDEMGKCLR